VSLPGGIDLLGYLQNHRNQVSEQEHVSSSYKETRCPCLLVGGTWRAPVQSELTSLITRQGGGSWPPCKQHTHEYETHETLEFQQHMSMKLWVPTQYDYETLSSNNIWLWDFEFQQTLIVRLWVPTDYDCKTLSSINIWLWNVESQQHMRHWVPTTHDYGTQQNMIMKVWVLTTHEYDTLSSNKIWLRDFEFQQHMIMRLVVPTTYDYETWSSNSTWFWDLEFQQHWIMNRSCSTTNHRSGSKWRRCSCRTYQGALIRH